MRTLYVDDIAVAEDTQDSLNGSENDLNIGVGFGQQPETFWSGFIDDVSVHNRAVSPQSASALFLSIRLGSLAKRVIFQTSCDDLSPALVSAVFKTNLKPAFFISFVQKR